ncbi:PREDICTED: uncharacterized protein LOC108375357 isoform X4 [Rhagoletis zephyria]|uniref:uncharacterized protein LOC108375357 isoform X3 n=1 Tax=Rhagoletis zephyria TaxID=28612 RepID=UPI0008114E7A|nr:PREDICTED: uncharacterized protein LOC108375357 isoform X3 [Rhagoletis zephyria]XP_017486978.1 PREDICTED: uncharacterized protein LOC108375357 isoform X4 [Rhagoletis zephyria]
MLNPSEDNIRKNLKVISLVKSNPLLFQSSSVERAVMWRKIDEVCGFDDYGAKSRWSFLYENFCKHVIKVAFRNAHSFHRTDITYVQFNEWPYFEDMKFMLPHAISSMGEHDMKAIRTEIMKSQVPGVEDVEDQDSGSLLDVKESTVNFESYKDINKEIPLTSSTTIKDNHSTVTLNANLQDSADKVPAEQKVGDKVSQVKTSILQWLGRHKDDFTAKKRKLEHTQISPTSTPAKATKENKPDKNKSSSHEDLSSEEINNEKPSTSSNHFSSSNGTNIKVNHTTGTSNTNLNSNTDKVFAEVKVGDKVYKVEVNIPEGYKNDFTTKERKIECTKTSSTSTSTKSAKGTLPNKPKSTANEKVSPGEINNKKPPTSSTATKGTKETMTDKPKSTSYQELSPEDQSLKAFFNSMLRTTQSLPKCCQSNIKTSLVLALRNQSMDMEDHTLSDTEAIDHKKGKVYSDQDRSRVAEAANRTDDRLSRSASLEVTSESEKILKTGEKTSSLTAEEVHTIVEWIEENSTLTLTQIEVKVYYAFNKEVPISTIYNFLKGRLYTTKKELHHPLTINSAANKSKRAKYVRALNNFIQAGKQIIYIDETKFKFFCRDPQGDCRAVHIHLIGAIATSGLIMMDRRRRSFKPEHVCSWMHIVLHRWVVMGNNLADLVVVCDNAAPCYNHLINGINTFNATAKATLLRLSPYSPMLNPMEIIWSKIKTYVNANVDGLDRSGPGVSKKWLFYFERRIDKARATIVDGDCSNAIEHTTSFHPDALSLDDMPVSI